MLKLFKPLSLVLFLIFIFCQTSFAQVSRSGRSSKTAKGRIYSFGLGFSLGNTDQNDLNQVIRDSKAYSGTDNSLLIQSYEYVSFLSMKLPNNMYALQLRATFINQISNGTGVGPVGMGAGGTYKYELNGYTIFPIIKYTALTNDIISLYFNTGFGYGWLDGKILNGNRSVAFTGSAFGSQIGAGLDFCFFAEHCVQIEGRYRYLPVVQNKVSSSVGLLPDGIGKATVGKEIESTSGSNLTTSLTGVSGTLSYIYNF